MPKPVRSPVLCRTALLAAALAFSSHVQSQAAPPNDFSELVKLSAARLELSRQVALAKWDSGHPVADPEGDPREAQVIKAAAEAGEQKGLPSALAGSFFADQIEASKLVQIVLIAEWTRAGRAPAGPRTDLKGQLRPALDRLQPLFIEELADTRRLRTATTCRAELADAVAEHVRANALTPLFAAALDRGLARVCSA
ncbi:MAG: chorismate mutase [Alcaligenaceae bacterium]|nr:MAG: chorismate mutase [Alcaligenaceae bacterium]